MSRHALIIEPDGVLAKMYATALERADFTVAHVTSAQAAITAADVQMPQVIILELQLPTHNGIAFLHELRSYAEWQDLPVIVHSYASPQQSTEERHALEANLGISSWLYKPRTSLTQLVAAAQAYAQPKPEEAKKV